MTVYEVDLRNRVTGNSVKTIYSGENGDYAWSLVDDWNKANLSDYEEECSPADYIGHGYGLVADCYIK